MKCGSQIAVGIVGGYLLGRNHKMRTAALMALMAAGGRLPVNPTDLLRGTPLGAEGGPLDKLTGDLRSQLVDAGRSVAMAAASSRIDSLSDKLQERADRLRTADLRERRPAEDRREPRGRPAPAEYTEEYYEEDYAEDYEPEEPAPAQTARRSSPLPRQEPRRTRTSRAEEETPSRPRARR